MVSNEDIKIALIARLKSLSAITNELPSTDEIRETQWQGTTFQYPNIRVRILSNQPMGVDSCYHDIKAGIQVNSEEDSSKEAEHISGIIVSELNNKAFRQGDVNCILVVTNLIPAIRTEQLVWRSEVLFDIVAS